MEPTGFKQQIRANQFNECNKLENSCGLIGLCESPSNLEVDVCGRRVQKWGMWIGADWSLDPCIPPRSSEQRYFPMHSTGVKPESGISQCRGHGSVRAHTQSSESKQSSKLFRNNCIYPDWSEGLFPSPQSQRERRRIDRRKQIVDKTLFGRKH